MNTAPTDTGVRTSHGLAGMLILFFLLVVAFYVVGFRFVFTVGAGR